MQGCERLVSTLEKIKRRYSSILFSKLVLYDHQYEIHDTHIRHYDIECEAVETLVDTLNTKVKAIKFKAFYFIKFFRKQQVIRKKAVTYNHSFVQNKSNNSFYVQPKNQGRSFRAGYNFPNLPRTTRHKVNILQDQLEDTSQILTEIDYSMSDLVNKIKFLNKMYQKKNGEDPQKDNLSQKMQKRNLILNKLSQLGNDISYLLNEQPNDVNLITTSKIEIKTKPPGMKSYKTSRQFNRTFEASYQNNI